MALAVLALSACQPSATPSPLPSPVMLEVRASAALMDLQDVYEDCARQHSLALILDEEDGAAGVPMRLRWGLPSNWDGSAILLGEDELAVVVHPTNPLETVDLKTVRSLFSGGVRSWEAAGHPAGGSVHPWGYPAGSDIRQGFEAGVLEGAMPEGSFYLAPGPAEMREGIGQDPAGVGFLPRRWVDASVKILRLEGVDPARLRIPVLALSPTEPAGEAAAWLACVQASAFGE